jgi:signal transduction histidine kinase/ActR/RegA family two-component response regulator
MCPELIDKVRRAPTAVPIRTPEGVSVLVAAGAHSDGSSCLVWLEGDQERDWSQGECAALALTSQVLGRVCPTSETRWTRSLEKGRLQSQLENVAHLTARLAHDFGNVLTGILGFAELSLPQLSTGSLPHRYVSEIYQAAQQGALLVHKLQLFSRRRSAAVRSTSLAAVVAEEENRLRAAWGPGTTLQVAVPHDLPCVLVEVDPLRQLLAALLDNAGEALDGGGIITLSARCTELSPADCLELIGNANPGPHLEVTVTDTGRGFSPEARRRLFREVFFSTKPRHRGLGLAVVYGILQTYHGGFRLGPDPVQGSAVRVFLPVGGMAPLVVEPRRPPNHRASPRVLVVDDDPLTLRYLCMILEKAGYHVQGASGGAEALDSCLAASEPFRLVISDIIMPGMNGIDLVRQLHDRDPKLKVLFISGQVPEALVRNDPLVQQFEVLSKPFRPEGLLRAVRAALENDCPVAVT